MANSTYTTTTCGVYITNVSAEEAQERYDKILLKLSKDNISLIKRCDERLQFHAWVYDKKTKKIIDTYNDTENWNMAKTYSHIKKLLNVVGMEYKEFDTISQEVKDLIELTKLIYEEDSVPFRSISYLDRYGLCLQRAYAKYMSNPKRFKLKIGTITWKFSDGTPDWDTEMDDIRDDEMIEKLINKVILLSKMKSKRLPPKVVKSVLEWWNTPKELASAMYYQLGY